MKGLGDTHSLRASIQFFLSEFELSPVNHFCGWNRKHASDTQGICGLVGIDVLAQMGPLEPNNRRRCNALIPVYIVTVFDEVRTSTFRQYWRSYHLARSFQPLHNGDKRRSTSNLERTAFRNSFARDENLCSASGLRAAIEGIECLCKCT